MSRRGGGMFLPPPASFEGTLEDFYHAYVVPNLPAPRAVEECHRLLVDYSAGDDPLFLVRAVSNTERRTIYRTADGSRFRATDNAPAWWIHARLVQGDLPADAAGFASEFENAPAHLFDVARGVRDTANSAGWHYAHILNVKDRNTRFTHWDRAELTRRFLRNVHPCNHFLMPIADWQRSGGAANVLGFFAHVYSTRYSTTWFEFLQVVGVAASEFTLPATPIPFSYRTQRSVRPGAAEATTPVVAAAQRVGTPARTYEARRLAFRADIIESLQDQDRFRVVTPSGTFEMTKAEFRSVFANVVSSTSYREGGLYHYPHVPRKALRFRVRDA